MVAGEMWKITKPQDNCYYCTCQFSEGQQLLSGLIYNQAEITRRDCCVRCGEKFKSDFFAYWLTEKRAKPQKLNVQGLIEFFKSALVNQNQNDPKLQRMLFLSAMLLMQKKKIKYVSSRVENGQRILVVEQHWDGQIVHVIEHEIKEDELKQFEEELKQFFY
jgi:hypothetical protein